jgi:hypothetical protein
MEKSKCGFDCEKCPVYIATVSNNLSMKKDILAKHIENGQEISLEEIECYGCNSKNDSKYPYLKKCDLRNNK